MWCASLASGQKAARRRGGEAHVLDVWFDRPSLMFDGARTHSHAGHEAAPMDA